MKNFTNQLIICSTLFVSMFASAQKIDTLQMKRDKKGEIFFAEFSHEVKGTMSNGNAFLKKVLNAQQKDEFRLYKEHTDKRGLGGSEKNNELKLFS